MNTRLQRYLKSLTGLLLLSCTQFSHALQAGDKPLPLFAQGDIPWQSLSPEEQGQLKGYRNDWNQYDTHKQKRILDGAHRYLDLPPERQKKIIQQHNQYKKLSPQERKRLREKYRRDQR